LWKEVLSHEQPEFMKYDNDIEGISNDEYEKICNDDDLYEKTMEENENFKRYEIMKYDFIESFKLASIEKTENLRKCPLCRR
jgi:hypothetical protein